MVEEKNSEMPPQEDSQKPLTEENGESRAEVKPLAANTAVDIPDSDEEDEFTGLTKDQLLEYSNSPFWKRLRMTLMILFVLGWLAMLVMAILIIIQAPQCEPLPTLQWLQESPLLQVDLNYEKISTITTLMTSLGLSSFYIPALISSRDYYQMNPDSDHVKETVLEALENLSANNLKSVTDYVTTPMHLSNPWVRNNSYDDITDGLFLNYSSEMLPVELLKVFQFWESDYNVSGFLVPNAEIESNPDLVNMTVELNDAMVADEIVLGVSSLDMKPVLDNLDNPGSFKEFVMSNYDDWHYYMFNPVGEAHRPNTPDRMACVTLAMMLLPGTPVLQVGGNLTAFELAEGAMIKTVNEIREKEAIKFGETQFVNNTSDNVIAYTRTFKGTPGYAVVVNLGDGSLNSTETVDFSSLMFVPEKGTLAYTIKGEEPEGSKWNLNSVEVASDEGLVIQFIAEY